MNVGQLKKMLKDVDDNMDVLISLTGEFDGAFLSPCLQESGVSGLAIYEDEEEENEAKLLNKPTEKDSFILVRCGFFDENHGPAPELN